MTDPNDAPSAAPAPRPKRDARAEETNRVAYAMIEAETNARNLKTERLRAAREAAARNR